MRKMGKVWAVAAVAVLTGTFGTHSAYGAVEDTAHATSIAMVNGVLTVSEDGAQVDDHLFDGTEKLAAKAKESNEVNLDKSMLGLAARKGGEKADLAQKLDYVVVRNYEFAKEGDYNMADLEAIMKRLDGNGWKHIVRNRDGKESNDICVKQDTEGVTREMVIINAEPKEVNLIHLKGNVSMADMHNLGGVMNGAMHGGGSSASSSSSSSGTSASSSTTLKHHEN